MSFSELNYLTVVLAGILNMFIGFLWYGPLFAKPWMKLVGLTPERMKEQMGFTYLTSFVMALIGAAIFQVLFMSFNPATVMEALTLGLLVWLGFVFTVMMNQALFVKKPFKLVAIDSGYYLVSYLVWSLLYLFVS